MIGPVTLTSAALRLAKRAAIAANLDVHRLDLAHSARRSTVMRTHGIDLVIDIGANSGQYVSWLRESGYRARIVSFEPIPEAFIAMSEALAADPFWIGVQAAVGAEAGRMGLHVSRDTVTSSLLAANTALTTRISSAESDRITDVEIVTLDQILTDHASAGSTIMVKVDVQGYEHSVLDGGSTALHQVAVLEIEMGLTQLYEGGSTIHDLLPRVHVLGFEVVSIDTGYVDAATGQVLDIDVLLARPITPGIPCCEE